MSCGKRVNSYMNYAFHDNFPLILIEKCAPYCLKKLFVTWISRYDDGTYNSKFETVDNELLPWNALITTVAIAWKYRYQIWYGPREIQSTFYLLFNVLWNHKTENNIPGWQCALHVKIAYARSINVVVITVPNSAFLRTQTKLIVSIAGKRYENRETFANM